MKKRLINWSEFEFHTLRLADRLDAGDYKCIVGIARGGLVPAVMLSHILKIPNVFSVGVRSRDEAGGMVSPTLTHGIAVLPEGEGALFVDDLVDSGTTARFLRKLYPLAKFAAVYAKPGGRSAVEYFGQSITEQKEWLVFPWETE